MKSKNSFLILFLLLIVATINYGQKLKSKAFYFPYIATPTSTKTINKNYVWSVTDRKIDNLGKSKLYIARSKSHDYSQLTGFYRQLLDRIPLIVDCDHSCALIITWCDLSVLNTYHI